MGAAVKMTCAALAIAMTGAPWLWTITAVASCESIPRQDASAASSAGDGAAAPAILSAGKGSGSWWLARVRLPVGIVAARKPLVVAVARPVLKAGESSLDRRNRSEASLVALRCLITI